MKMKISHFGYICFTLCICLLDAKDVRQISSLVPLDDWLDFKNRTRDVKPLDKLIGKLRATYDFVFHKPENVSNVGKILGMAAKGDLDDNAMNLNLTDSFFDKGNMSDVVDILPVDEKAQNPLSSSNRSEISKESMIAKLSNNRWLDVGFKRRLDKLEKLEKLDEAPPLSRLEIIEDEHTDNFDTETLDSTMTPYHSKFQLPYAIAQAFLRWLITLYYSTYNNVHHANTPVRESA